MITWLEYLKYFQLGFTPKVPLMTEKTVWSCHIYFNDDDIIIVCVHATPHRLNPFGHPMEKLSRDTPPEIIGKVTIDCLSESKLIEHEIDSLDNLSDRKYYSLPGIKAFYKLAEVKSCRALSQKYRLITVDQIIGDEKIKLVTSRPDKGGYLSTVHDPVYFVPPLASEVGEMVRLAMEYQPPMPKK